MEKGIRSKGLCSCYPYGPFKGLIDNIFSNCIDYNTHAGNITTGLSDHLPQFLFVQICFNNCKGEDQNTKQFIRDWRKFDENNFSKDFKDINWVNSLVFQENNCSKSTALFLDKINALLGKHAPLKKVSKKEQSFRNKPWINNDLKKLIEKKNKVFDKYIKAKNQFVKEKHHKHFKQLRNELQLELSLCKKEYFKIFFNENKNNIKATWIGIKKVININNKASSMTKLILDNGKSISDPVEISNGFNDFFSSIGKKVQNSVPFSHKKFSDFLNVQNSNSFFISPTNASEIADIIEKLNCSKSPGPYSIPYKIIN